MWRWGSIYFFLECVEDLILEGFDYFGYLWFVWDIWMISFKIDFYYIIIVIG